MAIVKQGYLSKIGFTPNRNNLRLHLGDGTQYNATFNKYHRDKLDEIETMPLVIVDKAVYGNLNGWLKADGLTIFCELELAV